MAQAQSQLLLHMFATKIYFVKLDFSGKIWETQYIGGFGILHFNRPLQKGRSELNRPNLVDQN